MPGNSIDYCKDFQKDYYKCIKKWYSKKILKGEFVAADNCNDLMLDWQECITMVMEDIEKEKKS